VYAKQGHWTYLGDSHVDGSVDHDSIKVGRSDGSFRAIQLRVSGGAINSEHVIVRFGNGTHEEIPIRAHIPYGGHTRAIDLPGDRRMIRALTSGTARATGAGALKSPCTERAESNPGLARIA